MKKNELGHLSYIILKKKKVNLNWILYLNLLKKQKTKKQNIQKKKTIKFLEENVSVNHHDLGIGSGFLDTTQKYKCQEKKRGKLGLIKILNFCVLRDTIK